MQRTAAISRLFVRLACVLSLALVAFAHRPVAFADNASGLSAYVLPDGSLPVLCLAGSDDRDVDHSSHGDRCDFCTIAKSSLTVDPPVSVTHAAPPEPAVRPAPADAPRLADASLAALPRGPPAV